MKAQVKIFNNEVNTNFGGDEVPKEGVHYTCKACISIDPVMKIEKNVHKLI